MLPPIHRRLVVASFVALALAAGCEHAHHAEQVVRRTTGSEASSAAVPEPATATAEPAPPPRTLKLPASLTLDPRRLVHVHTRFPGEVVFVASIEQDGRNRLIQYGDRVTKGQVLATVWSKDIGETKSELVEVLAHLEISEALLARLEGVSKGIVPEREILAARRDVESDRIALSRVERTLRSWRISEEEIQAIKAEARQLIEHADAGALPTGGRWAEFEIKAPMDGVILEKNFNTGDLVEPSEDLIKIGDMSRLQVLASVYEEDLAAIRGLADDQRTWRLDVGGQGDRREVESRFDLVGNVIDPVRRTAVLMGWIDNSDGSLAVGHFATAQIVLPADPDVVMVPRSAVESSAVWVQSETGAAFEKLGVEIVRVLHDKLLVRGPGLRSGQTVRANLAADVVPAPPTQRLADAPR
jgi:cobalt-zinc-cadmium efflux system membrane fusion protein